jgi:hypothetical protein
VDVEARFWELCAEATRLDDEIWSDCRGHERPMVEIIELVERHPEQRDLFVHCFCEVAMWRRPAPWSLVAFCMRRLRFPEIKELIHRDAAEHEGTAYYANHMNYWSTVMHAYHDAIWEEAAMWAYYSHELKSER